MLYSKMVVLYNYHPINIGDIPWDWLNEERWRLRTFLHYPPRANRSAVMLANAGFAYVGSATDNDDEVICCFCCAAKKYWQTADNIAQVHRDLSPYCPMVTRVYCNNVSFIVQGNRMTSTASISSFSDQATASRHTQTSNINIPTGDIISTRNPPCSFNPNTAMANRNQTSVTQDIDINIYSASDRLLAASTARSATQTLTEYVQQSSDLIAASSSARVSLQDDTPVVISSNQSLFTLAESSASTSSASVNHSNNSPVAHEYVLNTVTGEFEINTSADENNSSPTAIVTERPSRIDYADRTTRLESFHWPMNHPMRKEDLADAGFYYAGSEDGIHCFHCGVRLQNWRVDEDEDVWIAHARMYPRCAFLLQIKGQPFIDAVQFVHERQN